MDEGVYYYWLSSLYKLGSRRQNALLARFGSPRAAFGASEDALRGVSGITEDSAHYIAQSRNLSVAEAELRSFERIGVRFVSRADKDFPYLLSEIPDPPVGLYCLGSLPDDALPKVALIGSRRCSEYGLGIARRFGAQLAQNDVVVVSGMARGIDSMAHKGALEGGGQTVAVLGCGVDICYPAENRALRDDIARSGCVVSEYPPRVAPFPSYFPARNRIISGLCRVVVVVEAGRRSGTLITVEQALDQGRDIMAVPGSIAGKYSEGTNALIKQGAELASCCEDILSMLGIHKREAPKQPAAVNRIAPEERAIYDVLTYEPLTFDDIIVKSDYPQQTAQYLLTMLELKGYIQKLPGMRYIRKI
jgi:DNA processing protein